MSDHEADTREVRAVYCAPPPHLTGEECQAKVDQRLARFDRWIAAHDRQVKAEALREAVDGGLWTLPGPAEWLRDRADHIESQETP